MREAGPEEAPSQQAMINRGVGTLTATSGDRNLAVDIVGIPLQIAQRREVLRPGPVLLQFEVKE